MFFDLFKTLLDKYFIIQFIIENGMCVSAYVRMCVCMLYVRMCVCM